MRHSLEALLTFSTRATRGHRVASPPSNAPSGIAQLRKSSEQKVAQLEQPEPMNLDDHVFAEKVTTPPVVREAGRPAEAKSTHSVASAIPIKSRNKEPASHQLIPQSVPVPPHHQTGKDEFGYVTRHHRKTSIDDRRVRVPDRNIRPATANS